MQVTTTVTTNNENLKAAVFGGTRWGENGTKSFGQSALINVTQPTGNNQITLYFPQQSANVTFKFDGHSVTGQAGHYSYKVTATPIVNETGTIAIGV